MKKRYQVNRVCSNPTEQFVIVEAESKGEALEIAQELDNENQWENCWDSEGYQDTEWDYYIHKEEKIKK